MAEWAVAALIVSTAVTGYSAIQMGKAQEKAANKNADLARVEGENARQMALRNNQLRDLQIQNTQAVHKLNQQYIAEDQSYERKLEKERQTAIETERGRVDRAAADSREEINREARRTRARYRAVLASRGINIAVGTSMALLRDVTDEEGRVLSRVAANEGAALTDLITESEISAKQSERFIGKLQSESQILGKQASDTVKRLEKEKEIALFRGETVAAQRLMQSQIYESQARSARQAGTSTAVATVLGGAAKTYKFGYQTKVWGTS